MVATRVFDEIVDFIAGQNPREVVQFHLSEKAQQRLEWLLEKEKNADLTAEETSELEYYLVLEHLMRMAKARALKQLAVA